MNPQLSAANLRRNFRVVNCLPSRLKIVLSVAFLSIANPSVSAELSVDRPQDWRPVPEPADRLSKHEKVAGLVSGSGGVDIVVVGDSIAAALPDSQLAPYRVLNLGVPSDRTYNIAWRLTRYDLKRFQPKAVVLIAGTNDFWSVSGEVTAHGVRQVARQLKETWPKARILVFGILPRGADFKEFDAKRRTANAIIARHARFDGYSFITVENALSCNFKPAVCRNYHPDWIHPNEQGDLFLTRAILQRLAPVSQG